MMEIDVEKIMQEIREELKNNNWEDIPDFESVPLRAVSGIAGPPGGFEQEIDAMNRTKELVYAWPLSPKPIRHLVQRVIKRSLKFLFIQLMWQQNEFNAHAVRAMNGTKGRIDTLTEQSTRTKGSIDDLTEKTAALKREAAELTDRFFEENYTVETIEAQLGEILQGISKLEKRVGELENQLQGGK